MNRAVITVSGIVQGVGYRRFVEKLAAECKLNGWVKNLENGDVYCVVEGHDTELNQFLQYLRKGPTFARVTNVNVEWVHATSEFTSFMIKY
ncbi:MAG TPA: acylphosphatase [bacterium]|nr:acylphosphatase [bacterium]HMZ04131.1 acylphosphatase [bacterium]HNB10859.1 acylphosphatase [bacterium]HNC48959.1 acylphosphatase [bacterium]HNE84644.1 acylphosphatase [bacterium]